LYKVGEVYKDVKYNYLYKIIDIVDESHTYYEILHLTGNHSGEAEYYVHESDMADDKLVKGYNTTLWKILHGEDNDL